MFDALTIIPFISKLLWSIPVIDSPLTIIGVLTEGFDVDSF
jgi:hypothetical protein